MKCEKCGHEQPQGKFCSQCGGPLRDVSGVDEQKVGVAPAPSATGEQTAEPAPVPPAPKAGGETEAATPTVPPAPVTGKQAVIPAAPTTGDQVAASATPPMPATPSKQSVVPPVPPSPLGVQGVQGAQAVTPVASGRKLYQRNDKLHIVIAIILSFVLWGSSWMVMFNNIMSVSEEYSTFGQYTFDDSRDTSSHKRDMSKTDTKGKTATPTPVQTTTPPVKPDPIKVDAENAQRAFNQYHQYITARNYTAAYNQFTDQFKNQAGDVNSWASGFATTKESVVDSMNVVSQNSNQIIINFVLHATDYEGNGTVKRSFSGQATMVKVNNRWLIDSIEARQL